MVITGIVNFQSSFYSQKITFLINCLGLNEFFATSHDMLHLLDVSIVAFVCCFVVMRLGKKAKESESKSQVVDGINRLICTTKTQSYSLKGKKATLYLL